MTASLPWDIPKEIPRQSGKRKLFLTSDEHYHHKNILRYQKRPFKTTAEMDQALISNHNSVVKNDDVVIHVGDFSFGKAKDFKETVAKLNGKHFFMDGSHDHSLRDFFKSPETYGGTNDKIFILPKLFEFTFNGQKIVLCHYALLKWWASHYGTYHFFGHSHGKSPHLLPNTRDIGVDTTNFFPITIEEAIATCQKEETVT